MNDLDLNLLRVLAVVYETRSATAAAERLGTTQPAVSQALGRLREHFRDPLFVRASRGMVPTAFALSLRDDVLAVVTAADGLEQRRGSFRPQDAEGQLTIAASDYLEVALMRGLLPELLQEAPGVRISLRGAGGVLPKAALEAGQVDLAVAGYFADVPEGFFQAALFKDPFATAVPTSSRKSSKAPTRAEYFAAKHALVTVTGDFADRFADGELRRQFCYGSSSFTGVLFAIAGTPLWLTAPSRLLHEVPESWPYRVFPCPVAAEPISVAMVWHARTHRDPLRAWLRERFRRAAPRTAAG